MPTPLSHHKPSSKDIVSFLKHLEAFRLLDEAILKDLGEKAQIINLPKETTLFREQDHYDGLYIIWEGESVATVTQNRQSIPIGKLHKGDLIGEMQVLSRGKRMATVKTATNTIFIKFLPAAINAALEKSPETSKIWSRIIHKRLLKNRLATVLPKLFGPLTERMLQDIESLAHWQYLKQGQCLFAQGDPGESLYIVISGRLKAVWKNTYDQENFLGEILQGQTVGEMGFFTHEPRSANVHAMRNADLIEFSRKNFEQLLQKYPSFSEKITQIIIGRFQKNLQKSSVPKNQTSYAIHPISASIETNKIVSPLAHALSSYGSVLKLDLKKVSQILNLEVKDEHSLSTLEQIRLDSWLDEQETQYDFILYISEFNQEFWAKKWAGISDKVILLADADENPARGNHKINYYAEDQSKILLLCHAQKSLTAQNTRAWLEPHTIDQHFHIDKNSEPALQKIARYLAGQSIGLVLGGGGARGLAHIGLLKAFNEVSIPIDFIGGTSMGAIIAAQFALGKTHEEIYQTNREIWLKKKPHKEYTLPIFSLIRGKKMERILEENYGETDIEDLWTSYFCISANLSTAQMQIHRKGTLKKALRSTIAIPGIIAPTIYKNQLLVDGGLINNVPVDVMHQFSKGKVIAIDVSRERNFFNETHQIPSPWSYLYHWLSPFHSLPKTKNIFDILVHTSVLTSTQKQALQQKDADLYLRPPVQNIGLLDFEQLEDIIQKGYEYGLNEIDFIKKKLAT